MQLDTTIEERLRELEQVNDDMEQARQGAQANEENVQKAQIQLLSHKLEKAKNLFQILKFQKQAKSFNEVTANRFAPAYGPEQAAQVLTELQQKNQALEEAIEQIRSDNPQFDIILSQMVGW